ncbi:hypothetical protein GCM10023115_09030 [Pontixanthobacter gangjinensis]
MAKDYPAGRELANRLYGAATLLLALPAIQACAVASPAAIVSSTLDPVQKAAIRLHFSGDEGPQHTMFEAALRQSFQEHAVPIEDTAGIIADYAFSVRRADLGMVDADAVTNASNETIWVSAPRKARRFDECKPVRLRATLAMFRISNGKLSYRGSAESIGCDVTEEAANELADKLVSDAMAKSQG